MIIGISAKIGAGKDTVGRIIQYLMLTENTTKYFGEDWLNKEHHLLDQHSGWQIKKFAGKLKEIVALLTGCTVQDLESQDFKNKELGDAWSKPQFHWEFRGLDELAADYGYDYDKLVEKGYNNELRADVKSQALKQAEFDGWNKVQSENKYSRKVIDSNIPTTYRDLLQKIGTEAMRGQVHENIWVNALFADYKEYTRNTVEGTAEWDKEKGKYIIRQVPIPELSNKIGQELMTDKWRAFIPERQEIPNWIVTDMRFPNELKAIEERGGLTIRVNRDNGTRAIDLNPHASETALDYHDFDYVIDNDGSISDLINKVREILIKENLINERSV